MDVQQLVLYVILFWYVWCAIFKPCIKMICSCSLVFPDSLSSLFFPLTFLSISKCSRHSWGGSNTSDFFSTYCLHWVCHILIYSLIKSETMIMAVFYDLHIILFMHLDYKNWLYHNVPVIFMAGHQGHFITCSVGKGYAVTVSDNDWIKKLFWKYCVV